VFRHCFKNFKKLIYLFQISYLSSVMESGMKELYGDFISGLEGFGAEVRDC